MSKLYLFGSILVVTVGALLFLSTDSWASSRFLEFVPIAILIMGTIGLLTSLSTRRVLGIRRADALLTNLTVAIIAFAITFGVVELVLRLSYGGGVSFGEDAGYLDKKLFAAIRLNSWGFREREIDLEKPEGIYRIAVIGDSITFGQGVGIDYRFTNLLEEDLNDRKNRYQLLNFGQRRAETVDHLRFLNEIILETDPDYILLQWYTNDVEGHDKSGRPGPRTLIPIEIRENSAFFTLINIQLNRVQRWLGFTGSYEDYMINPFSDPYSPSSLEARQALQEFITTAKEKRLPLGIVLYAAHDPELDFLADRVLALCEKESLTCPHLGSMFEEYKDDPTQLWAGKFDSHPGILAHRIIADRLMESFEEEWESE